MPCPQIRSGAWSQPDSGSGPVPGELPSWLIMAIIGTRQFGFQDPQIKALNGDLAVPGS
jgi:hypothetical protein